MSVFVEPGYYLSIDNHVIRVTANKDCTYSWADRMILTGDPDGVAVIGWQREYGLGRDLVIVPLTARAVSARVRAAIAA